MKKPLKFLTISGPCVTDFGLRGKCESCPNAHEFTGLFDSKRYCKRCLPKKFPEAVVEYEKTDAKFSCPALSCNAKQVTYDEFLVGSCCENALTWTCEQGKLFRHLAVLNIYQDARKDEDSAEIAAENSDAKLEEAKEILAEAEKSSADAREFLAEKKKWRKTVQKRSLFTATEAMKEDNSDLEDSDYEPENDESAAEDTNDEYEELLEKMSCKVCMEKFDNEHPEATIIPCGHKSCFQCLSALPNKICPTCRAEFAMENVYKLY